MMPTTPPPPPEKPVLKRDGFTVRDGIITSHGHERVDGARLEALFHPDRLRLQRDQKKAADDAKRLFGRPFFAAQLRYYGISFPKAATESQLQSLLEKAVAAMQCATVPASVTTLHEEMKLEYEKQLEEWQQTVGNWDEVWRLRQEEEWAQLESPSERALYNLDRFMEHYFLTDGQPDPAKKPEPIALQDITDEQMMAAVHDRVMFVNGLEIAVGGQGPDRTMCIGWDRAAVCGLAGEIENMAKEKQRKRVQDDWERAMQSHRQFVKSLQPAETEASAPQGPGPIPLTAARGCFVVQCKTVMEKFPDHPNLANIALNISDSPANNGETLRAAVDLGVFQGTAVLSFSQPVVDWFVKYYDKSALAAAGISAPATPSGAKGGKRKAIDESGDQRPTKQRKSDEPPPPGRILLRMRGRELIEGMLCPDVQEGYLEFLDSTCTKFTGVFDIPGVGEDVEIEGFRVANDAAIEAPPWNWFWPILQQYPVPDQYSIPPEQLQ